MYTERGGEIEVTGVSDFDLVKTLECGQCFRWNADENGIYTGVALGTVVRLRRCGESVFITGTAEDFNTKWHGYFDLDRDYAEVRRKLCIDDFMHKSTAFGAGIRILHQDKWEVLCSFIISQNNNIPRIKRIVEALCLNFGQKLESNGKEYYTFPSAQRLAMVSIESLEPLRCGYRAAFIIHAARAVASGAVDLDALSRCSPAVARAVLKTLNGVGDKVADCVLLFGLHMLDAFPLDVWMKKAVNKYYGKNFDPGIFSPYAGIAQQYIFNYVRSSLGDEVKNTEK